MPTIHDVAKVAGVHRSTVSRVLTGKGSVSEESRKRVQEAARQINFHLNTVASAFKSKRKTAIGLLSFWNGSPNLSEAYYQKTLTEIIDSITRSKYHLLLNNIQGLAHQDNEGLQFCHETLLAGILLVAPRAKEEDLDILKELNIPSLLLFYRTDSPAYSYIDLDNRKGAQIAVEYLAQLGHRKIGYLGGEMDFASNARDRYAGYQRALEKAGLPENPDWVYQKAFSLETGKEGARKILALPAGERPTAFFCASDNIAVGAMDTLQNAGFRIPEDFSVAGFDDYAQTLNLHFTITTGQQSHIYYDQPANSYPALTTVRQSSYDIGKKAVEVLESMIRQPSGEPRQVLIEPELIIRGSTAQPKIRSRSGAETYR
jgi:DNA-binding LacI/PurR family transcriptional regulator